MKKRWMLKKRNTSSIPAIQQQTGLLYPLATVLANNNIISAENIDLFMSPQLEKLSNPFKLPDMAKAVKHIWNEIDNHNKIVVFGDFDLI